MPSIWQDIFGANSNIAKSIDSLAPVANPILQSIGQAVVDKVAGSSPEGQLLADIVAPVTGLTAPSPAAPVEPVLTFTESQWTAFTGNIDAGLQGLGMPTTADSAVNSVIASAATAAGFTVPAVPS